MLQSGLNAGNIHILKKKYKILTKNLLQQAQK